ncbi:hypothetical protein JTE90_020444 [Oedothorax gibbosus]|uniref:NADH dehydrogenase [ubiquinone] 1 alpha subcomplex subunit 6 n=1 Tax=Oedothorax gibbosus TaxID=931172 RepID=A0AAV6U1A4_9ARAC|nr:hypothetical protein JTE90_020444 [Oedothorax gibbosus]
MFTSDSANCLWLDFNKTHMIRDVTDIRVIDMLVTKGRMELEESVKGWKQKSHVMMYFGQTVQKKPKDFLSRFFSGLE